MEVCWPRFTLGMGVRVAGKIEDVLLALVTFLIAVTEAARGGRSRKEEQEFTWHMRLAWAIWDPA